MAEIKDPFDYQEALAKARYLTLVNVVLFFDVVGFSKGTTTKDMQKMIQHIDNIVVDLLWDEYNWNEKEKHNDLILIPTGDGYGIGFHPTMRHDTILHIAEQLFKRLTTTNGFKIRMGIAKGPNIRHVDKNEILNLFGYGINLASRVISLALENQILIHEDYAKELLQIKTIPELIEVENMLEIKHGLKIKVYNYYKEGDFGNPQDPSEKNN